MHKSNNCLWLVQTDDARSHPRGLNLLDLGDADFGLVVLDIVKNFLFNIRHSPVLKLRQRVLFVVVVVSQLLLSWLRLTRGSSGALDRILFWLALLRIWKGGLPHWHYFLGELVFKLIPTEMLVKLGCELGALQKSRIGVVMGILLIQLLFALPIGNIK